MAELWLRLQQRLRMQQQLQQRQRLQEQTPYPYARLFPILQRRNRRRAEGEGGSREKGGDLTVSEGRELSDDLMIAVLSQLPARSLVRFRVACKNWWSLMSEPSFTRQLTLSGLFVEEWDEDRPSQHCRRRLVPLAGRPSLAPDLSLRFMDGVIGGPSAIVQSCNGLLLCRGVQQGRYAPTRICYYTVNPLTQQHDPIPTPPRSLYWEEDFDVFISFDPARSRHYKAVATFMLPNMEPTVPAMFQGALHYIYSSESGSWKTSKFNIDFDPPCLPECVYWNGCLHWITESGKLLLSLNLDQDKMECTRGPILIGTNETKLVECMHIGESGGHLHVINNAPEETDDPCFDVWRLGMGCNEWTKIFHIQLVHPQAFFPSRRNEGVLPPPWYQIVHFVDKEEGEGDGEPSLILEFPGMLLAYHPTKNTYAHLCSTGPNEVITIPYDNKHIFPLMVASSDDLQGQAVSGRQEGDK